MKRPELKPYLLNWLNNNKGWHKKVDLYVIGDQIEHSAESTGRALRELAEIKEINVDYYDGRWAKHLAKYSSKDTPKPTKPNYKIEIINGIPTAVYG